MTTKRKAIPARVMVSVAMRQANIYGRILCPICCDGLYPDDPRVLEHMTPHATLTALGKDPDDENNLRWVHAECAAKKTNGTKATTAGSDKHMIAKAKRFDRINRGERGRKRKGPPLTHPKLKKTMSGKVVPR